MRGDAAFLQRFGGIFRVRCRGEKISAHAEEELNFPFVHLLDCFDRVGAVLARRTELKFAAELIKKRVAHPFPNSHRAIALHIRMTAHRTRTGAGSTNIAAEEQKIHDFLDGGDGVLVLR